MMIWKWMPSVVLLVGLMGCEHWNLEPTDVVSELAVEGTVGGQTFLWNPEEGEMQMGTNDEGAWCALPLNVGGARWSLEFTLVLPSSPVELQSELEAAIVEGLWPLSPVNWGEGVTMEMEELPNDAMCLVNGIPWNYNSEPFVLNPAVENTFHTSFGVGPCASWTDFAWSEVSPCQGEWLSEAFKVEWNEDSDEWVLTPPDESVTWTWVVDQGSPIEQTGPLVLPEADGTYLVATTPATPDNTWGNVVITRFFSAHHEDECEVDDVEIELSWEDQAHLRIRLVDNAGNAYLSMHECSAIAGEFEALEVSDFTSTAEGVPTRLVEFQCSVELQHPELDDILLQVETGQIAFPLSD